MKIGILGTGAVGKAFAKKLSQLNHQVMLGTRNVDATLKKQGADSLSQFLSDQKSVKLGTFEETSKFGELVILVSKGEAALDVIKSAGKESLKNKILIDITNPLDFSKGMPPVLVPELCNTNSLGEAIQLALPETNVVKTLNTMWNGLMLDPTQLAGGNHINFICGNNSDAKTKAIELLKEFGWKETNVIDLGNIASSRATEGFLPLWLRVYGVKKTGAFNFQLVS